MFGSLIVGTTRQRLTSFCPVYLARLSYRRRGYVSIAYGRRSLSFGAIIASAGFQWSGRHWGVVAQRSRSPATSPKLSRSRFGARDRARRLTKMPRNWRMISTVSANPIFGDSLKNPSSLVSIFSSTLPTSAQICVKENPHAFPFGESAMTGCGC